MFLGQLDVFFWLIYRSKRPALWALLSLKPQFLLPALPRILASKRNLGEFLAALAVLHVPFLMIRPSWPAEWIGFLVGVRSSESMTGAFIGRCGLLPWTIDGRDEVEVAFMIDKAYWGQGLGTEAARALVRLWL